MYDISIVLKRASLIVPQKKIGLGFCVPLLKVSVNHFLTMNDQ